MPGSGWTLVFHDRAADRVWLHVYDGEGRLVEERVFEARQVVVRGSAMSSGGVAGGLVMYSVEGPPRRVERRGSVLYVEAGGADADSQG